MRILFFGAGPLGSFYAHLFYRSGEDVTILARGKRYEWLTLNGLVLVNEITGEKEESPVKVVKELKPDDDYDLVIVLIRKNKLQPVLETLASNSKIKNILFMGNNALGFDEYLKYLPEGKLLFGFPSAGGGLCNQVVHYADREKPNGRRRAVTIGELLHTSNGNISKVKSLFESAGIPIEVTNDIDGWLKFHVALVAPLVCALYKHDCNNYQLAKDKETLRTMIRAVKEGGRVLENLGFKKRQPFRFNLFYWLPEFIMIFGVRKLLMSKFAEIAFASHAKAARDEMKCLVLEFQELIKRTKVKTPNIDVLSKFITV